MVQFKYGSLEKYKSLENKDDDVLYFLDNNTLYKGNSLISNIKTISGDFPETPTSDMKETYVISLKNGKMKYVTNELAYVDITSLQFDNFTITTEFAKNVANAIGNKKVTMPTLTVEDHVLTWTEASEKEITILTL